MIDSRDDGKMAVPKLKCCLKKKYKIKAEGFNTVIEELKQHISAKTLKLKCCELRVKQY